MNDKVTSMFELPALLHVRGPEGVDVAVDTQTWTSDFVEYMTIYAWGVRMQRSTASAKDSAKALRDMFDSMKRGEVPEGGGRGPSLSEEDEALLAYFNLGLKTKDQTKTGDFAKRLEQEVRQTVIKAMQAKGADEATIKAELTAKVSANRETIVARLRALPDVQTQLVAIRAKRAGKKGVVDLADGLDL